MSACDELLRIARERHIDDIVNPPLVWVIDICRYPLPLDWKDKIGYTENKELSYGYEFDLWDAAGHIRPCGRAPLEGHFSGDRPRGVAEGVPQRWVP